MPLGHIFTVICANELLFGMPWSLWDPLTPGVSPALCPGTAAAQSPQPRCCHTQSVENTELKTSKCKFVSPWPIQAVLTEAQAPSQPLIYPEVFNEEDSLACSQTQVSPPGSISQPSSALLPVHSFSLNMTQVCYIAELAVNWTCHSGVHVFQFFISFLVPVAIVTIRNQSLKGKEKEDSFSV